MKGVQSICSFSKLQHKNYYFGCHIKISCISVPVQDIVRGASEIGMFLTSARNREPDKKAAHVNGRMTSSQGIRILC
jgi:hypothetical protein